MPKRERSTDSATAVAVMADVDTSEEVSVAQVQTITREIQSVVVEVPLGELVRGYLSRHVEARMTVTQSQTLQRMVVGLRDQRAVLVNGKEVRTAADAIRWLLEELSDSD